MYSHTYRCVMTMHVLYVFVHAQAVAELTG